MTPKPSTSSSSHTIVPNIAQGVVAQIIRALMSYAIHWCILGWAALAHSLQMGIQSLLERKADSVSPRPVSTPKIVSSAGLNRLWPTSTVAPSSPPQILARALSPSIPAPLALGTDRASLSSSAQAPLTSSSLSSPASSPEPTTPPERSSLPSCPSPFSDNIPWDVYDTSGWGDPTSTDASNACMIDAWTVDVPARDAGPGWGARGRDGSEGGSDTVFGSDSSAGGSSGTDVGSPDGEDKDVNAWWADTAQVHDPTQDEDDTQPAFGTDEPPGYNSTAAWASGSSMSSSPHAACEDADAGWERVWTRLARDTRPLLVLRNARTAYDVYGALGAGTFGTVLLGADARSGLLVAIKVLDKAAFVARAWGGDADAWGALAQEATAMARAVGGVSASPARKGDEAAARGACEPAEGPLATPGADSPFLAHLLACWDDRAKVYLVMRYYPTTLYDYVCDKEPDATALKIYCAEMALGVLDLHTKVGMWHRDIKLGNTMLDAAGHAVLVDFGVGHALPAGVRSADAGTFGYAGTPGYLAPDVLRSCADETAWYGHTVDVYSLGVVFWELACAANAPHYDSLDEWAQARLDTARVADPLWRDLIEKMVDADPEARMSPEQVLAHPFFADVDLAALRDGRYEHSSKPDRLPWIYAPRPSFLASVPWYDDSYRGECFRSVWECAPERVVDPRHGAVFLADLFPEDPKTDRK
ncbi:kinase-like protein [Wolfiporia cocos MD-104 SS10]|uniref:non-specific serine/threonine protein kinase n=1 Tax=Wolfiporia cocos (strain MD-104) TaxID=742152 RepID=A0A2H3J3G9_WOLCO|nr:kinase-like protein [Wolfiporia cocos MD-104 SS10]